MAYTFVFPLISTPYRLSFSELLAAFRAIGTCLDCFACRACLACLASAYVACGNSDLSTGVRLCTPLDKYLSACVDCLACLSNLPSWPLASNLAGGLQNGRPLDKSEVPRRLRERLREAPGKAGTYQVAYQTVGHLISKRLREGSERLREAPKGSRQGGYLSGGLPNGRPLDK